MRSPSCSWTKCLLISSVLISIAFFFLVLFCFGFFPWLCCLVFSKVLGNNSALGLSLSGFGKAVPNSWLPWSCSELFPLSFCPPAVCTGFLSLWKAYPGPADSFASGLGVPGTPGAHPCTKSAGGRAVLETDPSKSWSLWKELDENRKYTQTQSHLWG